MTFWDKFIGSKRLFCNSCPSCNSDAPQVDTCKVCWGWDLVRHRSGNFITVQVFNKNVVSYHIKFLKQLWWQRYLVEGRMK